VHALAQGAETPDQPETIEVSAGPAPVQLGAAVSAAPSQQAAIIGQLGDEIRRADALTMNDPKVPKSKKKHKRRSGSVSARGHGDKPRRLSADTQLDEEPLLPEPASARTHRGHKKTPRERFSTEGSKSDAGARAGSAPAEARPPKDAKKKLLDRVVERAVSNILRRARKRHKPIDIDEIKRAIARVLSEIPEKYRRKIPTSEVLRAVAEKLKEEPQPAAAPGSSPRRTPRPSFNIDEILPEQAAEEINELVNEIGSIANEVIMGFSGRHGGMTIGIDEIIPQIIEALKRRGRFRGIQIDAIVNQIVTQLEGAGITVGGIEFSEKKPGARRRIFNIDRIVQGIRAGLADAVPASPRPAVGAPADPGSPRTRRGERARTLLPSESTQQLGRARATRSKTVNKGSPNLPEMVTDELPAPVSVPAAAPGSSSSSPTPPPLSARGRRGSNILSGVIDSPRRVVASPAPSPRGRIGISPAPLGVTVSPVPSPKIRSVGSVDEELGSEGSDTSSPVTPAGPASSPRPRLVRRNSNVLTGVIDSPRRLVASPAPPTAGQPGADIIDDDDTPESIFSSGSRPVSPLISPPTSPVLQLNMQALARHLRGHFASRVSPAVTPAGSPRTSPAPDPGSPLTGLRRLGGRGGVVANPRGAGPAPTVEAAGDMHVDVTKVGAPRRTIRQHGTRDSVVLPIPPAPAARDDASPASPRRVQTRERGIVVEEGSAALSPRPTVDPRARTKAAAEALRVLTAAAAAVAPDPVLAQTPVQAQDVPTLALSGVSISATSPVPPQAEEPDPTQSPRTARADKGDAQPKGPRRRGCLNGERSACVASAEADGDADGAAYATRVVGEMMTMGGLAALVARRVSSLIQGYRFEFGPNIPSCHVDGLIRVRTNDPVRTGQLLAHELAHVAPPDPQKLAQAYAVSLPLWQEQAAKLLQGYPISFFYLTSNARNAVESECDKEVVAEVEKGLGIVTDLSQSCKDRAAKLVELEPTIVAALDLNAQQVYFVERLADQLQGKEEHKCEELFARCVEMQKAGLGAELMAVCKPFEEGLP
jgi:hypothetical protein